MEVNGLVKLGCTRSVRNNRIIARDQIRGRTMQSVNAGFALYMGSQPDYYDGVSGTTRFGFGGNMTLVDGSGQMIVSTQAWENGKLRKEPFTSGTILQDPRAYFDRATTSVEPTYTVSGSIETFVTSGDIQNFVF